ncbi:hypothetical protein FSB08_10205 [Paraburkholderia sp. JPY432]|uniref:hypothetical protein n=1 Tax=Paraburkholderia TaxID=1822464 RepID=UPI001595AA97|nr:hypothetical protein [Paraburkholderia youngii]NVH72935.1 hypothetical protein [Paraburkholderia youngii]
MDDLAAGDNECSARLDQIHVARNERRFEPVRDQIAVRKRRQRNTRKNRDAKTAHLGLPPNRVVEMGRGSIWSDAGVNRGAVQNLRIQRPKTKKPAKTRALMCCVARSCRYGRDG